MAPIGSTDNPLRVAIVGSGPSGFYAAGHLLKSKSHPDLAVQVDMYDRLPTPWGLVRGGVAPDHPNIKAVSRVYEKTAAHPEFRFHGTSSWAATSRRAELADRYHAVIYAVGAQTDRRMGIPGEELPGSWAATEFVAWYNGHPDYRDLEFDLSCERAVVIGNGNVAVDVARMLALDARRAGRHRRRRPRARVLADSAIREIVVLGRRGPAQAAFTNPELLELGEMTDADVVVDPRDVALDPLSRAFVESEASITARKNVEILTGYAGREPPASAADRPALPASPRGDPRRRARDGIRIVRNELVPTSGGRCAPGRPSELETIDCGLVFRSIGYRGMPLADVPFDERARRDPQRRGPRARPTRRAAARRVRDRLDQARADRDHRHEQARRAGDRDAAARGPRAGRLPSRPTPTADSLEALLAERGPDRVTYAAGRRSTRREAWASPRAARG